MIESPAIEITGQFSEALPHAEIDWPLSTGCTPKLAIVLESGYKSWTEYDDEEIEDETEPGEWETEGAPSAASRIHYGDEGTGHTVNIKIQVKLGYDFTEILPGDPFSLTQSVAVHYSWVDTDAAEVYADSYVSHDSDAVALALGPGATILTTDWIDSGLPGTGKYRSLYGRSFEDQTELAVQAGVLSFTLTGDTSQSDHQRKGFLPYSGYQEPPDRFNREVYSGRDPGCAERGLPERNYSGHSRASGFSDASTDTVEDGYCSPPSLNFDGILHPATRHPWLVREPTILHRKWKRRCGGSVQEGELNVTLEDPIPPSETSGEHSSHWADEATTPTGLQSEVVWRNLLNAQETEFHRLQRPYLVSAIIAGGTVVPFNDNIEVSWKVKRTNLETGVVLTEDASETLPYPSHAETVPHDPLTDYGAQENETIELSEFRSSSVFIESSPSIWATSNAV